ncbi:carotenoid oxygenase family protein [Gordonia terrae]|uniref:carotenoid oxygenase family protein n=1 Tax=Gordonia terrae TaxID=2055 RepID=UPI00200A8287|nr:carotenoid oxygenase family protein [Gordonia terrae]UPW08908.1 carotenoid oxygenase family protein [Gordonia terrae]
MTVAYSAENPADTDTSGESPWDSQHREFDYTVRDVEGQIPAALRGALYRIGPGRLDVAGHPMSHIFDGDGMVSRVAIGPGGVHYRNRYVRTKSYAKSTATGKPPKGFSTQRLGGPLANAMRFPENMANTSVLVHDDVLYSLWEGGRPHRMDPDTLHTFGPESFGGALKRLGAFSAHPKVDPSTGEVFNFGLDFFPRPMIRCYRLDPRGKMRGIATVPIPDLGFIHDFALTERHMVFVLGPLVVRNPVPVALGLRPFDDALSYRPDMGTTIVLVPRDGGPQQRFEHESLFHFHVTNAFESGDETVVELVAHHPAGGWVQWNKHLRDYRGQTGPAFGGTLTRLSVNRRVGWVRTAVLNDRGCEFPQLDQRVTTGEHRFSYLAEASQPGGDPDSITTIDHRTGAAGRHITDGAGTICEPIFAPDPTSSAEGDGWLLTLEHQPDRKASRLLILRADRPGDGPIATAALDHHVPMTFHGAFRSAPRP